MSSIGRREWTQTAGAPRPEQQHRDAGRRQCREGLIEAVAEGGHPQIGPGGHGLERKLFLVQQLHAQSPEAR
jgi:hypothetical protein